MEETKPSPTLVSHAVKNGAILAGISIVFILVCYAVDYTLLVQLKLLLLSLLISVGYAIYAGINYRKEIGGFLSFGKAFQHGFVLFAVSGIIYTLFTFVLYYAIDPELPEKLKEAQLVNTEEMMRNFGMPEDKLDEALEKAREDMKSQYSPVKMIIGYLISLIIYAILALISGAIVKKKQPETF